MVLLFSLAHCLLNLHSQPPDFNHQLLLPRFVHLQHLSLLLQSAHQLSYVKIVLSHLPPKLLHFHLHRPQGPPVILFLPLLSRHELDQLPVLVSQVTNASIVLCVSLVHLELVGRFTV